MQAQRTEPPAQASRRSVAGAAHGREQRRSDDEQGTKAAVEQALLPRRARRQAGIAGHHDQVDGDHGGGKNQVLRQQRARRIEELRQHCEDEDDRLGVAGIDDEAPHHQRPRPALRGVAGFERRRSGCSAHAGPLNAALQPSGSGSPACLMQDAARPDRASSATARRGRGGRRASSGRARPERPAEPAPAHP